MAYDAHKNFAYSTVATAPSPASSGTSLVVASGDGSKFPAVPFNATVWPANAQPTTANAEIVRVTARSTDTLTITRAQESTSARSVGVGDQIAATVTAKTVTDIETATIDQIAALNATAANWSNNSHKITSVADPSSPQDAATKHYVDSAIPGTYPGTYHHVWPLNPQAVLAGTSFATVANTAYGVRVVVGRTGTLNDLAVMMGGTGHNVDIGIYDTSATTRNRLYHSGAVASTAGWCAVTGVGLSVTAGDHYDIAVVADSTSVSLFRATASSTLPYTLPTALLVASGGAAPITAWSASIGATTLPATLAESSMTAAASMGMIGWVT